MNFKFGMSWGSIYLSILNLWWFKISTREALLLNLPLNNSNINLILIFDKFKSTRLTQLIHVEAQNITVNLKPGLSLALLAPLAFTF